MTLIYFSSSLFGWKGLTCEWLSVFIQTHRLLKKKMQDVETVSLMFADLKPVKPGNKTFDGCIFFLLSFSSSSFILFLFSSSFIASGASLDLGSRHFSFCLSSSEKHPWKKSSKSSIPLIPSSRSRLFHWLSFSRFSRSSSSPSSISVTSSLWLNQWRRI